jgi:hypothetical protein
MQETIQEYRDKDAQAAVEFVRRCMHHWHVGTVDCEDKFVVYCNRAGQGPGAETLALEIGTGLEAMGWQSSSEDTAGGMAFAQSGPSFAWVVYNYMRKPVNWHRIDALLAGVATSSPPSSGP